MADFQKAFEFLLAQEGGNYQYHPQYNEGDKFIVCSNCFNNEGLKLDSFKIGIDNQEKCTNCSSVNGRKLTEALVRFLCHRFFVQGTTIKAEYGFAPLIQFNEYQYNQKEIEYPSDLVKDIELLEKSGKIGLFYYAPREWMIGKVEPLKLLQTSDKCEEIIDRIINNYPLVELTSADPFYRIRINPEVPLDNLEYDAPPDKFLGNGRFDDIDFPILYGSPDLELCIHECRITAEDNLFIGKLSPIKTMKLLDLSEMISDEIYEHESLDIAIHLLFLAGNHSYKISRSIAKKAKMSGFDGIIYPSYFRNKRTGVMSLETMHGISIRNLPPLKDYAKSLDIPNVAIFGRPINDGRIKVECINRLFINKVIYDVSFGPVQI
jgi:hypothetical protein